METNVTHNVKVYRDAVQLLLNLEIDNKEYLEKVISKFEEMDKSMAIRILLSSYEIILKHNKSLETTIKGLQAIYKLNPYDRI